jgi:hypothetical protein
MARIALDDHRLYLNRHLQWMAFNQRVLEEAHDTRNPLLERVKFLAITANNLDEFVEIRVSSFLQKIEHGCQYISPDGLTTEEELQQVSQVRCTGSLPRSISVGMANCSRRWPSTRFGCCRWRECWDRTANTPQCGRPKAASVSPCRSI